MALAVFGAIECPPSILLVTKPSGYTRERRTRHDTPVYVNLKFATRSLVRMTLPKRSSNGEATMIFKALVGNSHDVING